MENITANKFSSYLEVQLSGQYNMFSQDAIDETGLNRIDYWTIQRNYSHLINKYKDDEICNQLLNRLGFIN